MDPVSLKQRYKRVKNEMETKRERSSALEEQLANVKQRCRMKKVELAMAQNTLNVERGKYSQVQHALAVERQRAAKYKQKKKAKDNVLADLRAERNEELHQLGQENTLLWADRNRELLERRGLHASAIQHLNVLRAVVASAVEERVQVTTERITTHPHPSSQTQGFAVIVREIQDPQRIELRFIAGKCQHVESQLRDAAIQRTVFDYTPTPSGVNLHLLFFRRAPRVSPLFAQRQEDSSSEAAGR